MAIFRRKIRYFANQIYSYEEKNRYRAANRLCFRHYHDLLQVKFELPGLRRNAQIYERNPLLI